MGFVHLTSLFPSPANTAFLGPPQPSRPCRAARPRAPGVYQGVPTCPTSHTHPPSAWGQEVGPQPLGGRRPLSLEQVVSVPGGPLPGHSPGDAPLVPQGWLFSGLHCPLPALAGPVRAHVLSTGPPSPRSSPCSPGRSEARPRLCARLCPHCGRPAHPSPCVGLARRGAPLT